MTARNSYEAAMLRIPRANRSRPQINRWRLEPYSSLCTIQRHRMQQRAEQAWLAALRLIDRLRGSDEQCPACGSPSVGAVPDAQMAGYGPGLAVCRDCSTIWEYFSAAQLWDPDDPLCSFSKCCNNCAYRPDSPERSDPERWAEIQESIALAGGIFYCHKGVPITSEAQHGFDYPRRPDGQFDRSRLRLCRGFLSGWGARMANHLARQRDEETAHADTLSA